MRNYLILLFLPLSFLSASQIIIKKHKELASYEKREDVIMITSTGRSGSTMMDALTQKFCTGKTVLKSHLLTPKNGWKGKILFLFSSPDKVAESVFHISLNDKYFMHLHFQNMETTDPEWLPMLAQLAKENYGKIVMNFNQTIEHNLLSYDALGVEKQLIDWLEASTVSAPMEESCILAIKYENLWDEETVEALRQFLGVEKFELPKKKQRGYQGKIVCTNEKFIRATYNLGTEQQPIYAAYDGARAIWEAAPAYQFLKLK